MTLAKILDAVVRVYRMLERLRAIRDTWNICECNGRARNGERRDTEIWSVGEGRIAAVIHDIKPADTMVVVVVG